MNDRTNVGAGRGIQIIRRTLCLDPFSYFADPGRNVPNRSHDVLRIWNEDNRVWIFCGCRDRGHQAGNNSKGIDENSERSNILEIHTMVASHLELVIRH